MAFREIRGVLLTRAWLVRPFAVLMLLISPGPPSRAADLAEAPAQAAAPDFSVCSLGLRFEPGVPTAKELPFRHVWYGRFSGGRPYENKDAQGRVLIDWVDQRVCFPSKQSCDAWISQQRREFHHPEGFWTCLPLR